MYVPSHQVYGEMAVTHMGLWFDRYGPKKFDIACLLKCPTHVAKSIRQASRISINFAKVHCLEQQLWCVALEVVDRVGTPLTTFSMCRTRPEQRRLRQAFNMKSIPLFVYDELERCLGRCTVTFDPRGREALAAVLRDAHAPYAGRFNSVVQAALLQFEEGLERAFADEGAPQPIRVDCNLSDWVIASNVGLGSGNFRLDANDGAGLEQSVHQLVESLFQENAYRSPNVQQGAKSRELIDSLLIGDHVICLFESKAIGFTDAAGPIGPARLCARVQKDISKGLNQLRGATRAIRAGSTLTGTHLRITGLARGLKEPISIPDPRWAILGVLVLSDIECGVDLREVARSYLGASTSDVLYQVVDLTELRMLVGDAKTPMQFVTNLVLRWQNVKEAGTMGVRVRIRRTEAQ